jgi:mannose-6-phosphate isomerase
MNIPGIIILPPNRVWRAYTGGKFLDRLEGKSNPADSHFPEDWIASTTLAVNRGREEFKSEGLSLIEYNGNIVPLKKIMETFPFEVLGEEHFKKYGPNTQFLFKFLDSAIRLHIQAHPAISFSQKYLNSSSGKTEAYVILGTRDEVENPYIYLGFQHSIGRKDFKIAIENQDIEKILSCFEKIPVKPGDVFIVPGGLPHAIGEGVFMLEIMEPADFVVRLEFERGGYVLPEQARFMGRNIDFAMDMIDFRSISVEEIKNKYFCLPVISDEQGGGSESILIDKRYTNCFSVHKVNVQSSFQKKADTFYAGVVTGGSGCIISGTNNRDVKSGDKFLIPYNAGKIEYISNYAMEIILAFPPK